ncbi:MAG TPA: hypothetical protein VFZ21_05070 [Gemmatimonadaceae bacterium]|jgi:hypothetical protein|nr:hypothetical protein [Gemmatimonadaceae bacterium]
MTRTSAVLGVVLSLGLATTAATAQDTQATSDARWTPWVGCWQASARDVASMGVSPGSTTPLPVVCIAPAPGAAAIDLVTITGSDVAPAERIDANGTRRAVSREGCEGWETAEFSPDAKRIYLRSEHQCAGNRTRTSTGIMSMTPNGEWLDVQGVKVEANNAVRVAHYGRVPVPAALPAQMRSAIEGHKLAQNTAALGASDSVGIADVAEASKRADALVVQTWLIERAQGFGMNAKRLAQAADAGVPPNVIDVMVALSYPRAFAINLANGNGTITPSEQTRALAEANESLRDGPVVYMNSWDPFYSRYGGYGYYNGYGYGLFGFPGYYPWYRQGGVVVVRPSDGIQTRDTRGRMVKGRGYTRPSSRDTGGSGEPRSSVSDSERRGGSSSSDTRSSGGSSSGGERRTAKPRSP